MVVIGWGWKDFLRLLVALVGTGLWCWLVGQSGSLFFRAGGIPKNLLNAEVLRQQCALRACSRCLHKTLCLDNACMMNVITSDLCSHLCGGCIFTHQRFLLVGHSPASVSVCVCVCHVCFFFDNVVPVTLNGNVFSRSLSCSLSLSACLSHPLSLL